MKAIVAWFSPPRSFPISQGKNLSRKKHHPLQLFLLAMDARAMNHLNHTLLLMFHFIGLLYVAKFYSSSYSKNY